jgi:hypothetical protein
MQHLVVPFGRKGHRRGINVSDESAGTRQSLSGTNLFLVRRGYPVSQWRARAAET